MSSAISRLDPSADASSQTLPHGVVVHYHEIGLKGRNRGYFERRLVSNIRDALHGCDSGEVEVMNGRYLIHTAGVPGAEMLSRVARTMGVAWLAPCLVVGASIPEMITAAMTLLDGKRFATFAVAARRATKELPFTSRQINIELGAAIQAATHAGVNLDEPDVTVHVEVVGQRALVYTDRVEGPGGLPIGVSGTVVSLLSGGIDSPVATYRMLKRGARAVLCHFHSAPFTDASSSRKAATLAQVVADRQGTTKLYLVALGDAQQEIVRTAPPDLRVILYRRLMVRIAQQIARSEGAKALASGDSLGQVASQTLENMICADDAAEIPILRPLIGFDKQEIITQAREIGTYETSILPFEDCCSLFVPRSPATRASVAACREAESAFDVGAMVQRCVMEAELKRFDRSPARSET